VWHDSFTCVAELVHVCGFISCSTWHGSCICVIELVHMCSMGWLRLLGSIKLKVSFAKETYKRDYILQKRPIVLSILLTVATRYHWMPDVTIVCMYVWMYSYMNTHVLIYALTYAPIYIYIYSITECLMCACMYECSHIWMYMCVYMHLYMHLYIYIVSLNAWCDGCMHVCMNVLIYLSKEPPPPGGISYLLCSLIKNHE